MAIPDRDFGHLESSDGRMCGYVDRFGVERDMAGNAIAAGSRPAPGAFRQSGLVFKSGVAVPNTGNTNKNPLATIQIPAGLLGINGGLRVTAYWSYTNSANTKTLTADFGGSSVINVARTTFATDFWMFEIMNRGAVNSQVKPISPFPYGSSANAFQTMAVDTSQAQSLVLSAQLANSGETITLEGYTVEVLNP